MTTSQGENTMGQGVKKKKKLNKFQENKEFKKIIQGIICSYSSSLETTFLAAEFESKI